MLEKMSQYIAAELGVNPWQVKVAVELLMKGTRFLLSPVIVRKKRGN